MASGHHGLETYKDFWLEFQEIEKSNEQEADDEELAKTPDEGEQEAEWLQEAGFGFLVNKFEAGKEMSEDEVEAVTSSMSAHHAAVIKRRVDTLNSTLQKKKKYCTKIDVRDIFPAQPVQKPPKSPTSPRSEVVHPEWAHHRRNNSKGMERASFLKRGGYSMSGTGDGLQDASGIGVEMLSVQPKGAYYRSLSNHSHGSDRSSQLSPISDADITFDFSQDPDPLHHGPTHTAGSLESRLSPVRSPSDDLPNFSLVQDSLGITRVCDLSETDMSNVRSLALLELTSIFDTYNITYSRRRAKKKHKENGVFGVPLQTVLSNDQKRDVSVQVPIVFQEIINYLLKNCLDTEGILRIPGSVSRIKQLRQEIEEKFYTGTFLWNEEVTPHDMAGLMKLFLRELPLPLLTYEYIDAFAQVENIPDKKQQLQALNLLVLLLPDSHRSTLKVAAVWIPQDGSVVAACLPTEVLLKFLTRLISHSHENKMTLSNVAMIMAPNLFLSPRLSKSKTGNRNHELEVTMATRTSNIMKMFIKYHEILWTIPSFLMKHLRRQYELEQIRRNRDKSKMKFLGKKDKTEVYKKPALIHEADFQDGVIRVQAPHLTKSSTAIQLDDHMTAGDIVAKFRKNQSGNDWEARDRYEHSNKMHHGKVYSDPNNSLYAGDNTYLFEVGGNICERCLDHRTNMSSLYKANPNAEWIIKQRGTPT